MSTPLFRCREWTRALYHVQAECMRLAVLQAAREAYRSFLLAYNSHQLKSIFNVHRLDLTAVARSFGFSAPPKVWKRRIEFVGALPGRCCASSQCSRFVAGKSGEAGAASCCRGSVQP